MRITEAQAFTNYLSRPVLYSNYKWLDFEMKHRLLVKIADKNQAESIKGAFELIDNLRNIRNTRRLRTYSPAPST